MRRFNLRRFLFLISLIEQTRYAQIREEELVSQLLEIIDRINVNKVGMKSQLENEIAKYSDFRNRVLGMTDEEKIKQSRLDLRGYMKYILEKGSLEEKRELMQSIRSNLILVNKRIVLD